jgi:hypothetical protein
MHSHHASRPSRHPYSMPTCSYADVGSQLLNADTILYIVFTANFVGILCARSLHYQFYSWWVGCP